MDVARVASADQEVAQARHEAEMIAAVYVRLLESLPEDFARQLTMAWWVKPEPGEDVICSECGEPA
jgi:hypothetical protein